MARRPRTARGTRSIGDVALDLARQIRTQYTLAYTPSNPALDGSFRKITVVAKGEGRLDVRTRTGYRATPDTIARPAGSGG